MLLIDFDRILHKESISRWYGSPLWMLSVYNTFLRLISKNNPFLPLHYFSGHQVLKNNFQKIQEEVMKMLQSSQTTQEFGSVETLSKHISTPDWQCFLIKCYGTETTALAKQYLPYTAHLIQQQRQIHYAMLSILKPHASIPPHRGPSKACYRYHLTLACCPSHKAFINVNRISYHWKEGEAVLFDDTYEHFVENNTDSVRIVLFCDVERRLMFPFNLLNQFIIYLGSKHPHLRDMENKFNFKK